MGDDGGSESEAWKVQKEEDEAKTKVVMEKYGLSWALETWSHEEALDGNYFGDDPSSGGKVIKQFRSTNAHVFDLRASVFKARYRVLDVDDSMCCVNSIMGVFYPSSRLSA
ncbi:hypothetical protein K435DRAFT_867184 [Dendrothele bispora CBS 962.96]|uniref:Uncharacterized protein n=1 Tax=Dendrothele bispora (strain CBS 962.96) TaxID=1314807 RepID=A0A4S8LF52_DENBC|nr:hypothetical protein K435DRAFT_867184 [Dendrothele bispora CBS 962.96]